MAFGKRILELKNITKSYSGVTVLKGMDFTLHEGEIHSIVGENGAGKSTFIKILSGAIQPDCGEIRMYGERVDATSPQGQIDRGISTIYQDVDLVESLSVAENIFLGGEETRGGVIRRREQEHLSRELLKSLNVDLNPATPVFRLSAAQKQVLQMVKALKRKASVIIMDEPTASLGEEESTALMKIVRRLSSEGMGIIYISHHLEEVFDIADTITILKDGQVTGVYPASEVSVDEVIHRMVGRETSLFYRRERVPIGETVLEVRLMNRPPKVENVSFEVRGGEILGLGGLVGSGRTELVRLLFGADRAEGGEIFLHGRKLKIRSPRAAIKSGICMLTEDRKESGMFPQRDLTENITVARNERKLFVSVKRDRGDTQEMISRLNLKTTKGYRQEIVRLSGGNQQKAILGRWLLTEFEVIIFDEPTKGVDIGARAEIYGLMVELARAGKAILMVSSDMPELLSMSDRIAIMSKGRLKAVVPAQDLTENDLIKLYLDIQ